MFLVNWNIEWAQSKQSKTQVILERINHWQPEVICLTESHPDFLVSKQGYIAPSKADYGYKSSKGYKVLLWSAQKWYQIDNLGKANLPPGRFSFGVTRTTLGELAVLGICIPWFGSRMGSHAIEKRQRWQDHEEFIDGFAGVLAEKLKIHSRLLVVGDFNQRLAGLFSYCPSRLRSKLLAVLAPLRIVSSDLLHNERRSIDHLALSPGLNCKFIETIDNFAAGRRLSDHFGFAAEVVKVA